jgi:hypothetical protein
VGREKSLKLFEGKHLGKSDMEDQEEDGRIWCSGVEDSGSSTSFLTR